MFRLLDTGLATPILVNASSSNTVNLLEFALAP